MFRRHATPDRTARLGLLVAVAVLPGCLTSWLWGLHDEGAVPEVHTTTSALEIVAVHAATPAPTDGALPASLDIAFRPLSVPGGATPPHLDRFAGGGAAGRVVLERVAPSTVSATAAGWLEHEAWYLRLFDGQYMRSGSHVARLTLTGSLPAERLGRAIDPPADLPDWWLGELSADDEPFLLATARALRGFAQLDWQALLAPRRPPGDRGAVPVAWLDGAGDRLTTERLEAWIQDAAVDPTARDAARAAELLIRFDDPIAGRAWFAVPVPILLDAEDLALARHGDRLRYTKHERWDGRFVTAADAPPPPPSGFDLPLGAPVIAYSFATEIPNVPSPLLRTTQVLLTPLTSAIDFLAITNPPLARLFEWLFGADDEALRWMRRESARVGRQ